jgi:hypothetical protein
MSSKDFQGRLSGRSGKMSKETWQVKTVGGRVTGGNGRERR